MLNLKIEFNHCDIDTVLIYTLYIKIIKVSMIKIHSRTRQSRHQPYLSKIDLIKTSNSEFKTVLTPEIF